MCMCTPRISKPSNLQSLSFGTEHWKLEGSKCNEKNNQNIELIYLFNVHSFPVMTVKMSWNFTINYNIICQFNYTWILLHSLLILAQKWDSRLNFLNCLVFDYFDFHCSNSNHRMIFEGHCMTGDHHAEVEMGKSNFLNILNSPASTCGNFRFRYWIICWKHQQTLLVTGFPSSSFIKFIPAYFHTPLWPAPSGP
jgi:hypothetical protein